MSGPTPTPWRLRTEDNDGPVDDLLIETTAGVPLFEVAGKLSREREAANAALIVSAVNAYQPMLEALEGARSVLQSIVDRGEVAQGGEQSGNMADVQDTLARIRAVQS